MQIATSINLSEQQSKTQLHKSVFVVVCIQSVTVRLLVLCNLCTVYVDMETIHKCVNSGMQDCFWKWYAKLGALGDGSPAMGSSGEVPVGGLGASPLEVEVFFTHLMLC